MERILIPCIIILTALTSCSERCNDCLELPTKGLRYVDSSGTNLLFGDQALYNPDSLVIQGLNGQFISFFPNPGLERIQFVLEDNITHYTVALSDSLIDTLSFEFSKRPSASCCGDITYSTETHLNGQEIENHDLIIISH